MATAKKAAKKKTTGRITSKAPAGKSGNHTAKKAAKKKHAARSGNAKDNTALVRGFLEMFAEGRLTDAGKLLADDVLYHNMPLSPINGRGKVLSTLASFEKYMADFEVEYLNIAAGKDAVLTERIDRFKLFGKLCEIPVMGAFVVRDGKIVIWRDYFDLVDFGKQMLAALPQGLVVSVSNLFSGRRTVE